MKAIITLLGFSFLFASWAHAAGNSQNTTPLDTKFVTLNSQVLIEDDVIRLGDLFHGAGKLADRVVAYSPQPGGRSVFDARWLHRVAKTFKLDWRPTSASERLIVERDSQVISKSEVQELLYDRLVAEGGDTSSRVLLSNRDFRLHLPVGKEVVLGVDSLTYDAAKNRFSAVLAWGNGKSDRRRIAGLFERMTEVPVLDARKMRGDVIAETDLRWIQLPGKGLSRNVITDDTRLIGMAVKRSISAGRPISQSDVRRPLVVAKGSSVTMRLVTPTMQLTSKGKALEEGGQGDTIRISNSQTNTVVEAIIIGPGEVRVDTPVNLAMR
jgi:flagella basal body P-ring formation protein FlgA